jgi:hypothetical protein
MQAVAAYGFTERQARFLVTVMIHSGVFVERQYCAFAGIAHGQKTHDFIQKLIGQGFATAIEVGALHRGRMFHVHYKPLYAAIGERDNRHRKRATPGRQAERLMLLDAVLDDRARVWLGTETDKRRHFMIALRDYKNVLQDFPRLTFGDEPRHRVRHFPDKLPIGLPTQDRDDHVFLYLVNKPHPMDFRTFLVRHAELLRMLRDWTIRVLFPRPFAPSMTLFGHAARDQMANPLGVSAAEEWVWYCRQRRRTNRLPDPDDLRFEDAASAFRGPRFESMYRVWLEHGDAILFAASSVTLRDQLECRRGRVEFVRLTRQYLHLASLVGVA